MQFSSCLSGFGEWNVTLYEQKIKGTSKAIYEYDAWGGRDSHIAGYAILDTTEAFTVAGVHKLSFRFLNGVPSKDTIKVIGTDRTIKDNRFIPVMVFNMKSEGIELEVKTYQAKSFNERREIQPDYKFLKFKESKDSICFYDLTNTSYFHDSIGKVKSRKFHKDSIKIKKGNVKISQNQDGYITDIIINDILLSNNGKDSLMSNRYYSLKPKKQIKLNEFSDYGIFKEKIERLRTK